LSLSSWRLYHGWLFSWLASIIKLMVKKSKNWLGEFLLYLMLLIIVGAASAILGQIVGALFTGRHGFLNWVGATVVTSLIWLLPMLVISNLALSQNLNIFKFTDSRLEIYRLVMIVVSAVLFVGGIMIITN